MPIALEAPAAGTATYVARQPIFTRSKRLFGYELLFRSGDTAVFPDIDGDTATAQVLSHSLLNWNFEQLTNGRVALINFTGNLLREQLPLLFPVDKVIVEVLESVEPTEEILAACRKLVRRGFTLALDDFVYREELRPLIELAGLIKIDFMGVTPDDIRRTLAHIGPTRARFLAEKVETYAEFQQAQDMGFSLFQGYFFSKPETVRGRDIHPGRSNLLGILGEIQGTDCHFGRLETIFKADVSLAFKLLQIVNSAYYRRSNAITSVRHALTYLGCRDIYRLVTVLVISELANDKPKELLRQALIRARFCERLSEETPARDRAPQAFLTGLFSNLDAVLDDRLEAILAQLPLAGDIKQALLAGDNCLGEILALVTLYEKGDWDACTLAAGQHSCPMPRVTEHYVDALQWADGILTPTGFA